jgi:chromosomal replication initiator protein
MAGTTMHERDRSGGARSGVAEESKRLPARAAGVGEAQPARIADLAGALAGGPEAWASAAPPLCRRFGDANYARWLAPLVARFDGRGLALEATDRKGAQTLRQHFLPGIEAALREIGFAGEVAIRAPDEPIEGGAASAAQSPAAGATEARADESGARPAREARYTFDRFVVGESNRSAHEAARLVADCPGRFHNPLYLHGGVGLGKTHLATAIGHAVEARGGGAALVCSADRFRALAMPSGPEATSPAFVAAASSVAIFDDVQLLAREPSILGELFRWLDELIAGGGQVVLTCDLPPPAIPSLATRLDGLGEGAFTAEILAPDLELRREIVRRRAAASGLAIGDEVVELVAASEGASVRALEGAFNRVRELAAATERELTLAVAREALARRGVPAEPPDLDRIAAVVAAAFDLSVRDLRARRRRDRSASLARQVAVHVARRLSGRPLAEIAIDLGFRDHSVAAHACAALRSRLEGDAELAARIQEIERRIGRSTGPVRSRGGA